MSHITEFEDILLDRKFELMTKMLEENVDAVVYIDNEDCRNPAVRYYSNHPSDAILVMAGNNKSILCPWDINLAKQVAHADTVIPFTKYGRDTFAAIEGMLKKAGLPEGAKVEVNPDMGYLDYLELVYKLPQYQITCRRDGVYSYSEKQRMIKDEFEIEYTRKAAEITNGIIKLIEKQVREGKIKTELDVALLIEKECRAAGCERTSFETLAAGSSRSFAIHCFPSYTNAPFADKGLSILDFGVCYNGYASDVTMTFAKGRLSEGQEEILRLVQEAADEGIKYYKPGIPVRTAALKVDRVFAKAKRKMPHSLGHGTGLQIHEAPFVRGKAPLDCVFQPGMIVTLEPGLYDPELGGCRLENDVLITEEGNEVLTHSLIVRIV